MEPLETPCIMCGTTAPVWVGYVDHEHEHIIAVCQSCAFKYRNGRLLLVKDLLQRLHLITYQAAAQEDVNVTQVFGFALVLGFVTFLLDMSDTAWRKKVGKK